MCSVVISKSSRMDTCEAVKMWPASTKSELPNAATKSSTLPFSVRTWRARRESIVLRTTSKSARPRSQTSRKDDARKSAAARSQDARRAAYSPPTCSWRARESISSSTTPLASGSKATGATVRSRKSISSAVDGSPNSDASWSSKPVGAPTYSFSARWAIRACSFSSMRIPAAAAIAPSTAHSNAAEEDRPDPISTSLVIDIVPPRIGWPV